jgi:hypothetical protein
MIGARLIPRVETGHAFDGYRSPRECEIDPVTADELRHHYAAVAERLGKHKAPAPRIRAGEAARTMKLASIAAVQAAIAAAPPASAPPEPEPEPLPGPALPVVPAAPIAPARPALPPLDASPEIKAECVLALARHLHAHCPGLGRMRAVIDAAAAVCRMTRAELLGPSRRKECVEPRHVAIAVAYLWTGFSLPRIGDAFGGRDHTTVLHAVRKWRDRIQPLFGADSGEGQ